MSIGSISSVKAAATTQKAAFGSFKDVLAQKTPEAPKPAGFNQMVSHVMNNHEQGNKLISEILSEKKGEYTATKLLRLQVQASQIVMAETVFAKGVELSGGAVSKFMQIQV
jgi:hypothetical protein